MKSLTQSLGRNPIAPLQLEAPKFRYEQDTWANSRTLNVERIAEHWQTHPTAVRVFLDRKLGSNSMVLLRKDSFEVLTNLISDLEKNEAFIKQNFEAAFRSVRLVQKLIDEQTNGQETPLKLAVEQMTHIWGQFSSTIEFHAKSKKVRSSKLTPEEIELAAQLAVEDEK